jgi:hypothetical protein
MQGVELHMMKHSFLVLAAMGLGLMGLSAEASAVTVQTQQPAVQSENSSLLTEVRDHRRGKRDYKNYRRGKHGYNDHYRYDRRRHGYRCGSWSNNCRYRYGGYYYQNPWWLLGAGIAIGGALAYDDDYYGGRAYGGYGDDHVAWCSNRYRSYNPRRNTWVSYSGHVRQCISPYGP